MRYFFLLALLCLLAGCGQKYSSQKFGANDPFKNTMVPSEFFTINADQPNVIEAANGTTIALPKGCFKDKHGNVVTGEVNVELAEALTLDKMLASNLTTTSDGQPLETGGMIYFKATANGEELSVNKNKPVYIEIPSERKRGGMLVYKGVRDDNGNMNWIKPKPTAVFLTPVDINNLDFLPEGFEDEVNRSMPFAGYKEATKAFTDSLYYSFSASQAQVMQQQAQAPATAKSDKAKGNYSNPGKLNEPYYNPNAKIEKGAYTKESYDYSKNGTVNQPLLSDSTVNDHGEGYREIDPARIKALKDVRFNNTLIATREFEQRLQSIFKTCNADILDIYVKNLDRNMWELDQMAADKLGADPMAKQFKNFAALKLTNVKDAPEQASLMKEYYEKQVEKNRQEIKVAFDKVEAVLKGKQQVADSMTEAYTKLLWKREKYRMERYGFTWTDNGWINIDTGWAPKVNPAKLHKLEVKVEAGNKYDRVHVYVIFEDMQSLYKLNPETNAYHYAGNADDHMMLMQNDKKAVIVAVAYKDTIPYLGIKTFVTGKTEVINTDVTRSSQEEINYVMHEIENGHYDVKRRDIKTEEGAMQVRKKSPYAEENSVRVDLEFQDFFYKEQKRQEGLYNDQQVLSRLYKLVYPCDCKGEGLAEGKQLFRNKCRACHSMDVNTTGPALAGATSRHERKWLYAWTRDWSKLVAAGDIAAMNWQNYAPSEMRKFPNLTDKELKELYDYIDCAGGVYALCK